MSNEQGEDLYEDVKSAFMAAEELQAEEPSAEAPTTDDSQEDSTRERDETGKFVAKKATSEKVEETPEPEAVTTEAPPESEGTWKEDKPPQSWTPAAREKWSTIPEDLRREIIRREEASVMGVRKMQEQFAPAQQFVSALEPFIGEAMQAGQNPAQYIGTVMQSERVLRTADVPTKFNELLRIADQYGVPLRDVINKSVGQEVLKAPQQQVAQIPDTVARELQEMRAWREQMEQTQLSTMVESFGSTHEFFNDVRHIMADLVERGMAPDVPTAYEQACWMVPEVRQVMLERQGRQQASSTVAQRQKQASGASVPHNGKVAVAMGDDEDDSVAETVRKAFVAAQGRV